MTTTIWKFQLEVTDDQNVMMPEGSKILSVAMQGDTLNIWAQVNPSAPFQRRTVQIYGTGHPIKEADRTFIGTVQMANGALVWHIFEKL